MKSTIKMIRSGRCFGELEILQKAIEKKGKLPKDYFERDENFCEELGCEWKSKEELRIIRENLIEEILKIINLQNNLPYEEKMDADHYARYFHALAILKVDKTLLKKTNRDYLRNAFIELWQFDDGSSEGMWETIDSVSWFISEAVKGIKGMYVRESIYPDNPEE